METLPDFDQETRPTVSVITTLLYPRERPLDCLSSWTRGQQFSQEKIELVIVVNGRRGSLETQVSQILRPQDRVVAVTSTNEMEMYNAGAHAAHGEWLMFTEPHCVAEPDCLQELLEYVIPRKMAGACVRTLPTEDDSPVARMEARMYLEDDSLQREDDWRKFTKRGTLVRKSAYEAVGGFNASHLRYAETTFAAALHDRGFTMGFAPKAAITHYNSTDLGELLGYVWEYRRQELLRSDGRSTATNNSCEIDPALSELMSGQESRRRLRAILKVQLRRAIRSPGRAESRMLMRIAAGLMLPRTMNHLLKRPIDILQSAWRFASAWLAFQRRRATHDERYAAYRKIWQTFGDLSVATLWRAPQNGPAHGTFPTGQVCALGTHASECCAGFHSLEKLQDSCFRWSGAVAVIRYQGPVHRPVAVLNVLPIRSLKPKEVAVLWNKTRLSYDKTESTETRWVFKSKKDISAPSPPRADGEWLTMLCPPLKPHSDDPRVLGLPLVSVEVRDASALSSSGICH